MLRGVGARISGEEDARRVYAPGDVAGRLGVSGQRVRQLAAVYERVHGDLPRDQRGRVWPEPAVEALELAHVAVLEGRAGSVEQALRVPEGAADGPQGRPPHPTPGGGARGDTEALAAVVEELRLLRGAVEGMSRRMAGLERENRELREVVEGATVGELEAPAATEEAAAGTGTDEPRSGEAADQAQGAAGRGVWRHVGRFFGYGGR